VASSLCATSGRAMGVEEAAGADAYVYAVRGNAFAAQISFSNGSPRTYLSIGIGPLDWGLHALLSAWTKPTTPIDLRRAVEVP
jgi:hypothetical protein